MSFPCAPSYDDLLADPLVQAVMRADKVERDDLAQMLSGVAAKLANRRAPARAVAAKPQRYRLPPPRWYAACEARPCA